MQVMLRRVWLARWLTSCVVSQDALYEAVYFYFGQSFLASFVSGLRDQNESVRASRAARTGVAPGSPDRNWEHRQREEVERAKELEKRLNEQWERVLSYYETRRIFNQQQLMEYRMNQDVFVQGILR
jgi:hypothetical protein